MTIFLIVYMTSVILNWFTSRLFHKKTHTNADLLDVMCVFIPIVNSAGIIINLYYVFKNEESIKFNRFFRL